MGSLVAQYFQAIFHILSHRNTEEKSSVHFTYIGKCIFTHPFELIALSLLQKLLIYHRQFYFGMIINVNFQFMGKKTMNE